MAWFGQRPAIPAADPAERRFIERVKRGETDAFGELVRRYERRAFAVAYRLLGHREDAEDLVQDCFMAALDHIDSYDPRRPFAPWFFRLIVNRGHHAIDARRVRAAEPLNEATVSTRGSPGRALERAELGDRVDAALGDLPERQRLVVQLHELDGFSTGEVAELLDIAEATVRWTLHEARKRLRVALVDLKEKADG